MRLAAAALLAPLLGLLRGHATAVGASEPHICRDALEVACPPSMERRACELCAGHCQHELKLAGCVAADVEGYCAVGRSAPVVTLPTGGQLLCADASANTFSCRGIQYGTAERWRRSRMVTLRAGEQRNATAFGPVCPDNSGSAPTPGQTEQCLYLNVFAPKTALAGGGGAGSLPVLVWIHGGA